MTLEDLFTPFGEMRVSRERGPLHFRILLQPLVAVIIAVRIAVRDARVGRPPFFLWSYVSGAKPSPEAIRMVWKDVGKVFIAAVVLDLVYGPIFLRGIYPIQTLFVGLVLAIIPYLRVRGPATRIARRFVLKNRDTNEEVH